MPDSCVIDCSAFVLPIDTMIRVTSKYGPRRRRMHKGVDLKVQIGDTTVRLSMVRYVLRISSAEGMAII